MSVKRRVGTVPNSVVSNPEVQNQWDRASFISKISRQFDVAAMLTSALLSFRDGDSKCAFESEFEYEQTKFIGNFLFEYEFEYELGRVCYCVCAWRLCRYV